MIKLYEKRVTPFLTFNGKALEAMNFYKEVFPGSVITRQEPYGEHPMASTEDSARILHGAMTIFNEEIIFMDMVNAHPSPDFSWATSIVTMCKTEAEFDDIFAKLAAVGTVMMGPEQVGDIRKCAWVTDQFGVTWQPLWP